MLEFRNQLAKASPVSRVSAYVPASLDFGLAYQLVQHR